MSLEQVSSNQVGCGEIFVTGNGDQRPAKLVGHVLNKPGLPTTGRTLQHDRQASFGGDGKQLDLPGHIRIKRLMEDTVLCQINFAGRLHQLLILKWNIAARFLSEDTESQ